MCIYIFNENVRNVRRSENMNILTVKQTANKLNCSERTVYRLVQNNELPHIRLGGMILFNEDTLNDYLQKLENKTKKEVS